MSAALEQATHIEVESAVRYWEDATVNGMEDSDGSRIPAGQAASGMPASSCSTASSRIGPPAPKQTSITRFAIRANIGWPTLRGVGSPSGAAITCLTPSSATGTRGLAITSSCRSLSAAGSKVMRCRPLSRSIGSRSTAFSMMGCRHEAGAVRPRASIRSVAAGFARVVRRK